MNIHTDVEKIAEDIWNEKRLRPRYLHVYPDGEISTHRRHVAHDAAIVRSFANLKTHVDSAAELIDRLRSWKGELSAL